MATAIKDSRQRTRPRSVQPGSARPGSVRPSKVDPTTAAPFTLDQELEPFGKWTSESIWVPPKDSSTEMAESMLKQSGLLTSKEASWAAVRETHHQNFTQVREIELTKASIRLPKGKLFVSVTEQQHFDRITDEVPDCVKTRLDEFMAGPGKRHGVRVYYLKPLCIEVDDELHFTSRKDLLAAIEKIQEEVFTEYRRLYFFRRPKHLLSRATDSALAIPRSIIQRGVQRRQKVLDQYQAKLEFERRKTALRAAKTHGKFRSDGCTFNEMLDLTNPLERVDVAQQFGIERNLSKAKRDQYIRMAAGHLPWFVALSIGASYLTSIAISITFTPPVMVCDPAFVAEFPGSDGVVMKIGHFDEVAGVKHIEL